MHRSSTCANPRPQLHRDSAGKNCRTSFAVLHPRQRSHMGAQKFSVSENLFSFLLWWNLSNNIFSTYVKRDLISLIWVYCLTRPNKHFPSFMFLLLKKAVIIRHDTANIIYYTLQLWNSNIRASLFKTTIHMLIYLKCCSCNSSPLFSLNFDLILQLCD